MLKVWIARDGNGDLYWYKNKPCKQKEFAKFFTQHVNETRHQLPKDDPWGKGLTWESEPRELELVDAKKEAEKTLCIALLAKEDGQQESADAIKGLQEQLGLVEKQVEKYKLALGKAIDQENQDNTVCSPQCLRAHKNIDVCSHEECNKSKFNHYLTQAEQELGGK